MNPAIKAAWIAALRSGEYKQGTGGLRAGGEYCCLGVLCDLAAKAGIGKWEEGQGYLHFTVDRLASAYDYPPYPVVDWAGLEVVNPEVNGARLTSYNDGTDDIEGRTFPEIANLIEAYL